MATDGAGTNIHNLVAALSGNRTRELAPTENQKILLRRVVSDIVPQDRVLICNGVEQRVE